MEATEKQEWKEDEGWMDDLDGASFVSFASGPVYLEFKENNPTKRENSWGKSVWDWDVWEINPETLKRVSELVLSTSSKRLRRGLSGFAPLSGKHLVIERDGEKMETRYHVGACSSA